MFPINGLIVKLTVRCKILLISLCLDNLRGLYIRYTSILDVSSCKNLLRSINLTLNVPVIIRIMKR